MLLQHVHLWLYKKCAKFRCFISKTTWYIYHTGKWHLVKISFKASKLIVILHWKSITFTLILWHYLPLQQFNYFILEVFLKGAISHLRYVFKWHPWGHVHTLLTFFITTLKNKITKYQYNWWYSFLILESTVS